MRLWYKKPANYWEEALPLGNGKLGAMVFSGIPEETVTLNDDTLWSGYPKCNDIEGASRVYKEARDLVNNEKYNEAQKLIEDEFLGEFTESYMPLGTLHLKMADEGSVTDYFRELSLDTATVTACYKCGGVCYTRTAYVSAPAGVMIYEIEADVKGKISFEASLSSQLKSEILVGNGRITLTGVAPSHVAPDYINCADPIVYEEDPEKKGMKFCAIADIRIAGGSLQVREDSIRVSCADKAVIYLSTETSFDGPFVQPFVHGKEYLKPCVDRIESAKARELSEVYKEHVDDYHSLYGRVAINLEVKNQDKALLPTDERLTNWKEDDDASLFSLLYQYGRYLLISSSRPGTTPANLQGIWNAKMRAPWSSNYTLNINTEMNYWPVNTANVSELYEPLLAFTRNLVKRGAHTAKEHYGARGAVAHHNSDIWCLSNPVGKGLRGGANFAFWPLSIGWLSNIAYDHYLYSEDLDFLRDEVYPIISEAARFFLDVLSGDENGGHIFAPSTSPENVFIYKGKALGVCKTTTMTTAIIRETLENTAQCCERMGIRDSFYKEVTAAIERLPEYQIGEKGQLLEWNDEFKESEPHHRHMSHLYPLYPGNEISDSGDAALLEACKNSVEGRGDESTGWALAWRVCLWSRLHDGEHAYSVLKKQLRPISASSDTNYTGGGGSYPNLFGAHPPFQIDSNFGAVAGMTEMFLQSTENKIEILPALPGAFGTGSVKGLLARGGYSIDLEFKDTKLVSMQVTNIKTDATGKLEISYKGKTICKEITPLKSVVLTKKDFEKYEKSYSFCSYDLPVLNRV